MYPESKPVNILLSTTEAEELQNIIRDRILKKKEKVDLKTLDFIKPINCSLTFSLADSDHGIKKVQGNYFICQLSDRAYKQMVNLLQPFVENKIDGPRWLYDLGPDSKQTELLFSPSGDW